MGLDLKFRGSVWYVMGTIVDPTGEKVRVRKSTGFGKADKRFAEDERARITHDVMSGKWGKAEGPGGVETLGQAIDLYMSRANPPGRSTRGMLKQLKTVLGSRQLMKLSGPELMVWASPKGNVPGTVARKLACVTACLAYVAELGVPMAQFKLRKPTVDDARDRWMTKEQRDHFVEVAGEVQDEALFLCWTGARLGEMMVTTVADLSLDKEQPSVVLRSRKGKGSKVKTRHVPVRGPLLARLREKVVGLKPKDRVFKSPVTGQEWRMNTFYSYWGAACARAEVEDFRPHDCRHTFASLLIQGGVRERVVADLLGHSTLALVMRYTQLAPDHLDEAVRALDRAVYTERRAGTELTHA